MLSNSSNLPHCIETTLFSKPCSVSPFSPLVGPAVLSTIAAASTEEESSSICEDPDSTNSSSTPTILSASAATSGVKFLGGERKKRRKYYLSGRVNNKIFHQIVDSGADLSVIPRHVVQRLGLVEEPIDTPFPVYGFQSSSSSSVQISTKCNVPTDLGCGLLPVTFFVADIHGEYALLGSDESSGFKSNSMGTFSIPRKVQNQVSLS